MTEVIPCLVECVVYLTCGAFDITKWRVHTKKTDRDRMQHETIRQVAAVIESELFFLAKQFADLV